jgi:DNA repair protein RecO (recombination protein O)
MAQWPDIVDGLALTGHFLSRDLLTQRPSGLEDTRARLVERLRRASGLP